MSFCRVRFAVTEGQPGSALAEIKQETWVERGPWRPRLLSTIAFSTCMSDQSALQNATAQHEFRVVATRQAFDGDQLIYEKTWDERIPRDFV